MRRQPTDFAYHLSRYVSHVLPARHGASPWAVRVAAGTSSPGGCRSATRWRAFRPNA